MLRLDRPTAFTFMLRRDDWRRSWVWIGLLMLVAPPIGWHLAMGYRRAVGLAARAGSAPLLPPFRANWLSLLSSGIAASSVILAYASVPLIAFWSAALPSSETALRLAPAIALFFALAAILPPIGIPLLPPMYLAYFPELQPSPLALTSCAIGRGVVVFVLPSVFLNVCVSGELRSAFRIDRAVRFIVMHPRLYFEAWILSCAATVASFLLGPFCTWG